MPIPTEAVAEHQQYGINRNTVTRAGEKCNRRFVSSENIRFFLETRAPEQHRRGRTPAQLRPALRRCPESAPPSRVRRRIPHGSTLCAWNACCRTLPPLSPYLAQSFSPKQPDVLGPQRDKLHRPEAPPVHIKGPQRTTPRALRLSIDSYVR